MFWGWLADQPFSKRDFSHIEPRFAVNLPEGQATVRDGSNLNCLPAAKQSERWPVRSEIWKVETWFFSQKNLAFKYLLAHLQRLRRATRWDGFWTMPHAGKILWTWSFALRVSPRTFCAIFTQAYCSRQTGLKKLILQSCVLIERITRKLDLDAFYQVGFKFQNDVYFYSSKLTGGGSDEVTPRPSTSHTLMGLDCIHWMWQQNFRIRSQPPDQQLCYKARWFYGMVTSRPFTYLEPSIAARSSGASFNIIE